MLDPFKTKGSILFLTQITFLSGIWINIKLVPTKNALFNLNAGYIMQNAGLDEAQAAIKITGRNINNLKYADDSLPYGRKQRGTKEPLEETERRKRKSWLKDQHSEN